MSLTKYIILDTNNWIYLSNGFNVYSEKYEELHYKIFELIKKRVEDRSIVLITNDLIFEEWERNKSSTEANINDLEKKLNLYLQQLNNVKNFLKGGDCDKEINLIREKLTQEIKERINKNKNHIQEVEELLTKKTLKIEITEKVKVECHDWAIKKRAPFVGDKKNSAADAAILFSSIRYIEDKLKVVYDVPLSDIIETDEDNKYEEVIVYPDSYFVSSNKGDFSSPTDREKIHPDLEAILKITSTQFHFALHRLINLLEEEFISIEETLALDELNNIFINCPVCNKDYTSIMLSEPFLIPDANKLTIDPNQLVIPELEAYEKQHPEKFQTYIEDGTCPECDSDFFKCPCGKLNHVEHYDKIFECQGECGRHFIVNTERDKKGMIHGINYQILKGDFCKKCGYFYSDDINNGTGICNQCNEHYINN